jgi:RND family efflux transporter MFP subunit
MKKRRILVTTICLVVVGVVLGIVFTRDGNREPIADTAEVTRADIVKTVFVDGSLEVSNTAYLSFGVTGTVTEVLVEEGNNVTEGQVLARLDAPSLESSAEMAELQVEIAEQQVKAARAQYEIALAALDDYTPYSPVSEEVLELQADAAKASWEAAKLNLKIAGLNLEMAQLNLEKAVIVAPLDGVVADVTMSEGQELSAAALAAPGMTLVGAGEIEMRGLIDEIDVALVKVGQAANITVDALPDEILEGTVAFVSPTGTSLIGVVYYETTITLEVPVEGLRDGMTATAEVVIERRDDVLVIPNKCLQGTLDSPKVVLFVDGQEEERDITLGLSDGIDTEVLSGLEEGDKVVIPSSEERQDRFFGMMQ